MSPAIAAVVFDAYGTLLSLGERRFARDAARLAGADRRRWTAALRESMTRPFADDAAMVAFFCERFSLAADSRDALAELLAAELRTARTLPGARAVPAFLRRRGLRIGVLSNASSAHKAVAARLGLLDAVDASAWSCDEAFAKPDPRLYARVCERLGVSASATLVVGDSLPNDVLAPRRLGMHALHVGAGGDLEGVAELGFRDVAGGPPFRPLVPAGSEVRLGGTLLRLGAVSLLGEDEQGRYNLVARCRATDAAGALRVVYLKRFLHPEAAWVEELMHRLHGIVGVPACDVAITGEVEPCLVATPAPGEKLADEAPTPERAFEFGRQCALGYLFANADLRPRNAFLAAGPGGPRVTMVDLEHGLFNLALDTEGVSNALDPRAWDAQGVDALRQRIRKRVLTEKTTRRARRTFLPDDDRGSACARAFHEGWNALYRQVQSRRDAVLDAVHERAYAAPPLIVGTLGHRRAFCRLDIEDLAFRLGQDAEDVFLQCY